MKRRQDKEQLRTKRERRKKKSDSSSREPSFKNSRERLLRKLPSNNRSEISRLSTQHQISSHLEALERITSTNICLMKIRNSMPRKRRIKLLKPQSLLRISLVVRKSKNKLNKKSKPMIVSHSQLRPPSLTSMRL